MADDDVSAFTALAPVAPTAPEAIGALDSSVTGLFHFDYDSMALVITGPIAPEAAEVLASCFPTVETRQAVRDAAFESRHGVAPARLSPGSPDRPRHISVPQLAIRVHGALEVFEETHFLDASWRLTYCDITLGEAEFPLATRGAQAGMVDIGAQGRLEISFHDAVTHQLTLLEGEPGWTTASLAVWLDAHIPHPDLTQSDVRLFIHNALTTMMAHSTVTVDQLARDKQRLRKALETKIAVHRADQRGKAFQKALFDGSDILVNESLTLGMGDVEQYAPNWLYEGSYQFRNHLYPFLGELPSEGEEFDCAVFLDEHSKVACWARNISNKSGTSFWLQTSTDRFYPDFVGELKDGRIFAVEYKGQDRWSNDDSREKRAVGDLWASASKGRCVFVMPRGPDRGAIDAAFASQLIVK